MTTKGTSLQGIESLSAVALNDEIQRHINAIHLLKIFEASPLSPIYQRHMHQLEFLVEAMAMRTINGTETKQ